ncbi:DHA2 family multidrug resistance protein-like MFS transporter [Kribbella amoyensis]|uniref:DHA2 family multidrug resistance protein-like MFS transporter n=1 Tax=Kribbella amoyensis TaxID=996641 RepID=A0A561BK47_9ACTN|nr:MFS transporter [Kribbella amoyensis]TWD79249.1 DHA2 family multidrug resistance protein-like MFS transporter [Kribbella amoyensis]
MSSPERAGRKEWIALGVLALPLLLVSMDVSVLYFAVPFISADLGVSATEQLWIFDIYGFVLAGLLITMGSLGDRIGRRRLLLIGAVGFGLASLAAAYAQNPEQLIAARAVLGLGGATLMPSTLALIRNLFHDPVQRGKAIAFWSAVMLGGISLGPVLGGFLLEHFWWGSVFLINTPAMVLLLILAPLLLPEFKAPVRGRFDLLGSVLSLATVLPVIWGIKELAAHGIGVAPVAAIVAGLLLGAAFLRRQRTATHPMIELPMFRNRAFSGALAANAIGMVALVGNAVFMTQYLQLVLGMGPLEAALWSLVPSVAVGGAAPLGTALAQKMDRAYVLGMGFLIAASGFVVLTQVEVESRLWVLLAGSGLLAAGLVMVMSLVTEAVVGTVAPERAGSASALMETCSEFGGALGIAVLGSIGTAAYRSDFATDLPSNVPAEIVSAAREGLPAATAVAAQLPAGLHDVVLTAARHSFNHSLNVVAVVGAVLLATTAVVVTLLLRGTNHPAASDESTLDATGEEAGPALEVTAG